MVKIREVLESLGEHSFRYKNDLFVTEVNYNFSTKVKYRSQRLAEQKKRLDISHDRFISSSDAIIDYINFQLREFLKPRIGYQLEPYIVRQRVAVDPVPDYTKTMKELISSSIDILEQYEKASVAVIAEFDAAFLDNKYRNSLKNALDELNQKYMQARLIAGESMPVINRLIEQLPTQVVESNQEESNADGAGSVEAAEQPVGATPVEPVTPELVSNKRKLNELISKYVLDLKNCEQKMIDLKTAYETAVEKDNVVVLKSALEDLHETESAALIAVQNMVPAISVVLRKLFPEGTRW